MLLHVGCIVPSSTPCRHLVLFTEKKGRYGLKLYIDYHILNSNTNNDIWLLFQIDELLAPLKGAYIFSILDLRDGYH